MYLQDLMSRSYLTESQPTPDEITLLPAGVLPEIERTLVISRADFEEILVKYRASEPAAEAVLMAIGTAREDSTEVWQAMLANEFVVSHYSKLTDTYYAEKLASFEEPEKVVEEESAPEPEAPIHEEPEPAPASVSGPVSEPVVEEVVPVETAVPAESRVAEEVPSAAEMSAAEEAVRALAVDCTVQPTPESEADEGLPYNYLTPEQQDAQATMKQEAQRDAITALASLTQDFVSSCEKYGYAAILAYGQYNCVSFVNAMKEKSTAAATMLRQFRTPEKVFEGEHLKAFMGAVEDECRRLVMNDMMSVAKAIYEPVFKIMYTED